MAGVNQYIKNILISIDQFINTLLWGDPDETMSSRAYRLRWQGVYWPSNVINGLFCRQRNHCRASLEICQCKQLKRIRHKRV